jgi:hypothetical protein
VGEELLTLIVELSDNLVAILEENIERYRVKEENNEKKIRKIKIVRSIV